MKALVGAFNQEKALVGAFSVTVKTDCESDGSSAALICPAQSPGPHLCWLVRAVQERGGQLDAGLVQQPVQGEAHVAQHAVTQEPEQDIARGRGITRGGDITLTPISITSLTPVRH